MSVREGRKLIWVAHLPRGPLATELIATDLKREIVRHGDDGSSVESCGKCNELLHYWSNPDIDQTRIERKRRSYGGQYLRRLRRRETRRAKPD